MLSYLILSTVLRFEVNIDYSIVLDDKKQPEAKDYAKPLAYETPWL